MPRFFIPAPHLPQEFDYSCVPACVRMVLAFYGEDYTESYLRALFKTKIGGTSTANVMIRLPELGYTASIMLATFYELEQIVRGGIPCIAQVWTEYLSYWDEAWMHDLVVIGFDDDLVLVNDPAFPDAPKEIPRGEFLKAWAIADRLIIKIEKLS